MNTVSILESATFDTLNTMTRDDLRKLARSVGIKTGRNRQDTLSNLMLAHRSGLMHAKVRVEFCAKPSDPTTYRVPIFGKKFSTGKDPKITRTLV